MKRYPRKKRYDVLIVGAGPAGLSTALHLYRLNPSMTQRVLVLEEASHPRAKPCAGGITRLGEESLAALGLTLAVPSLPVRELRSFADRFDTSLFGSPVFRVVERSEFDAWFAEVARARGIRIEENEAVIGLLRRGEGVEVRTGKAVYLAKVVVAADGARSTVRRILDPGRTRETTSVLLEAIFGLTGSAGGLDDRLCDGFSAAAASSGRLGSGLARFDFRRMEEGLQGYLWDFPALRSGAQALSLGLFDSKIARSRVLLPPRPVLAQELSERAIRDTNGDKPVAAIKGFPLLRYEPRRRLFSGNRTVYVGDAAGADPMLGEGISFALGYGEAAAEAIRDALVREEYSFLDYYDRVRRHRITSHLKWRRRVARLFYRLRRPWFIRLLWLAIPTVTRLLILFVPKYIPGRKNRLSVNR